MGGGRYGWGWGWHAGSSGQLSLPIVYGLTFRPEVRLSAPLHREECHIVMTGVLARGGGGVLGMVGVEGGREGFVGCGGKGDMGEGAGGDLQPPASPAPPFVYYCPFPRHLLYLLPWPSLRLGAKEIESLE